MRNHLVAIIAIFLLGCSTKIPMNQDDICVIIDENPRWSNSLLDAKKKWNAEPSTVMAIIRQESSFNANAAPDREKVLGFIPWKRPSSARGSLKLSKQHGSSIKKKLVTEGLEDQTLIVL